MYVCSLKMKYFLRRPRRMSVWRDRSWASSTITTEYFVRRGSIIILRTRAPSVRKFMRVRPGVETSSKRMVYPTSRPSWTPISCATRRATVVTATRRGWVQQTIRVPPAVHPASSRYWGICVVFPQPVSPTITTTECFSVA